MTEMRRASLPIRRPGARCRPTRRRPPGGKALPPL